MSDTSMGVTFDESAETRYGPVVFPCIPSEKALSQSCDQP